MNQIFEKYNTACTECGTLENLTRHHLKNMKGKKTGVITILCRSCHDDAEEHYRLIGVVKPHKVTITHNEQLQLDYMNGKLSFYSSNDTYNRREIS